MHRKSKKCVTYNWKGFCNFVLLSFKNNVFVVKNKKKGQVVDKLKYFSDFSCITWKKVFVHLWLSPIPRKKHQPHQITNILFKFYTRKILHMYVFYSKHCNQNLQQHNCLECSKGTLTHNPSKLPLSAVPVFIIPCQRHLTEREGEKKFLNIYLVISLLNGKDPIS